MAHRLALASPQITADAVDVTEFPDLANQYFVASVPKIVVNDKVDFVGALPESHFVAKVLEAVATPPGGADV